MNPNENNIQQIINARYADGIGVGVGQWVKVNELCLGGSLRFESEEVYVSFDDREGDNYCKGNLIKNL